MKRKSMSITPTEIYVEIDTDFCNKFDTWLLYISINKDFLPVYSSYISKWTKSIVISINTWLNKHIQTERHQYMIK